MPRWWGGELPRACPDGLAHSWFWLSPFCSTGDSNDLAFAFESHADFMGTGFSLKSGCHWRPYLPFTISSSVLVLLVPLRTLGPADHQKAKDFISFKRIIGNIIIFSSICVFRKYKCNMEGNLVCVLKLCLVKTAPPTLYSNQFIGAPVGVSKWALILGLFFVSFFVFFYLL